MRNPGYGIAILAFAAVVLGSDDATNSKTVVLETQERRVDKVTQFAKLRDSLTEKILAFEPEELRMLGDPSVAGKLKDWSPETIKAEVDFCREGLKQLDAVKISTPTEKLDREVLKAHLTYLEYYYGQYHGELGNLQISVYPYDLIQYEFKRHAISTHDPVLTRNHLNAVEGLLRGLPNYLNQQESNLVAGLKRRPPDTEILQSLITRIGSPDKSDSIRAGLKEIERDLESMKLEPFLPVAQRQVFRGLILAADAAYARHIRFLKLKLLPHAREAWSLGNREYRARFALVYGKAISFDELVVGAEAELNRLNEEMVNLAHELKPNLSLSATLEEIRKRHAPTEQELIQAYEQVQERLDKGLTRRIGLPGGTARYIPAPAGVPVGRATNWPAPLLSRGLGIVLVNTSSSGLKRNALVDLLWIAAHEGNPGHAAQSFLFQSAFNNGAPLCRFLNVPDEVGYVRGNWYAMANIEGWAFYTERLLLASDLLTPEERLAALTGQALRAARVVVDVRMHTGMWSRAEATTYLVHKAGISVEAAKGETYRYSSIPLQAVSYYLGARQFEQLYGKYHLRFGDQFYVRMLSLGPVPPMLIDDYLAAQPLEK